MRYALLHHWIITLGLVCTEWRGLGLTRAKAPSDPGKVAAQITSDKITLMVTSSVPLRILAMNGMTTAVGKSTLSSASKVIFHCSTKKTNLSFINQN